MNVNRQTGVSVAFDDQLRLLRDAELASGVAAPDPRLIWFCFLTMIVVAVICMFFAASGNRAAANIALFSLWPLFALLTFFQRSPRFKRNVQV